MKLLNRPLAATGLALILCALTPRVMGQGAGGNPPGGFDFSQMFRQMVDNLREPLEVTDDNEWKVIADQIQKVTEARMQSGLGGMGMFGMMGRRGGPGGARGGALPALFSNPEGEALQRAIDAKASNAELKAAVAKLVEARKQKQAALEKAQEDLRKLLSVRQEAIAYSLGLL
jgi:hypothetical protein